MNTLYQLVTLSTAQPSGLETRIRSILSNHARVGRRYAVLLLILTIAIVSPLAMLRSQAQTPAQTTQLSAEDEAQKSISAEAIKRAKQIALASQMYVQDYDQHFPPHPIQYGREIDYYLRQCKPYLGKDSLTSPLDKPGTPSFKMNPALAHKTLAAIKDVQNTVFASEGKQNALPFRYDKNTHALIIFADGHVKMITREGAKGLIWSVEINQKRKKRFVVKYSVPNDGKPHKIGFVMKNENGSSVRHDSLQQPGTMAQFTFATSVPKAISVFDNGKLVRVFPILNGKILPDYKPLRR